MEKKQFTMIDMIEQMCSRSDIRLESLRFVRDIMNSNVKTLTLDHNVSQCLKFIEIYKVRHVPVVDLPYERDDQVRFIGIVSQRDVLRQFIQDAKGYIKQEIDRRALRQLLVQIVSRKPKSVFLQTPIQEVISIMIGNHIDMVPVLKNSDLVGIVTTTDILKLLFKLEKVVREVLVEMRDRIIDVNSENSAGADMLSSWISRTVKEIMTEQVVCLEPQDHLDKAMEILQAEKIRHLMIVDEQRRLLGLISDRDILKNLPFAGRRPPLPPKIFREHLFATKLLSKSREIPVETIMVGKSEVLHIDSGCHITEAARILYEKKISCLPVLDAQEKILAIVTVTDLMRALLDMYEPVQEEDEVRI
jgi:CBS domain-containing protein